MLLFVTIDLELVFNAIIALVVVQQFEIGEGLVNTLCDKLLSQSGDKRNALRLRLFVLTPLLPLCSY